MWEVVAADMTFPELWQDLNFHLPSLLYVQNFLVPHPIWSFPASALARPRSSSDQGHDGKRPSPGGSCRDRYGHPEAESCSPVGKSTQAGVTGSSVMPGIDDPWLEQPWMLQEEEKWRREWLGRRGRRWGISGDPRGVRLGSWDNGRRAEVGHTCRSPCSPVQRRSVMWVV